MYVCHNFWIMQNDMTMQKFMKLKLYTCYHEYMNKDVCLYVQC